MNLKEELDRKISCPICGEEYKILTTHVKKKHGLTKEEFVERHKYCSFVDKVVEKFNSLFVTVRGKWLTYYIDSWNNPGARTNSKEKDNNRYLDRALTDSDIRKHVRGKGTIGVLFPKGYSKFFCFDIDCQDLDLGKETTKILLPELRKYTDKIYLEFSGSKGYHIWIFFNQIIKTEDLLRFATHTISSAFNDSIEKIYNTKIALKSGVNIEFRPESNNSKAVKLPLGIHIKTKELCCFLDNNFSPVPNQIDYFLEIEQIDPLDWSEFPEEKTQLPVPKEIELAQKEVAVATLQIPEEATSEHCQLIWEKGLQKPDSRNRETFHLAMWFKEQGKTEEEVVQLLLDWTDREYEAGRTEDSSEQAKADIVSTVNNVFIMGYSLGLKTIELTKADEGLINIYSRKLQKTVQAILTIGKLWHKEGFFFLSVPRLIKMTEHSARKVWSDLKEITSNFDSKEEKFIIKVIEGTYKEEGALYYMPYLKLGLKNVITGNKLDMLRFYTLLDTQKILLNSQALIKQEKIIRNNNNTNVEVFVAWFNSLLEEEFKKENMVRYSVLLLLETYLKIKDEDIISDNKDKENLEDNLSPDIIESFDNFILNNFDCLGTDRALEQVLVGQELIKYIKSTNK